MPGFDGTGPMGYGPRTGWGRGYCPPGTAPSNVDVVYGVGRGGIPWGGGRGRAFGGGRGFRGGGGMFNPRGLLRPRYWANFAVPSMSAAPPMSRRDELNMLKEQQGSLDGGLRDIKGRISELEKEIQK